MGYTPLTIKPPLYNVWNFPFPVKAYFSYLFVVTLISHTEEGMASAAHK